MTHDFHNLEPVERLFLPDGRPHWKGLKPADIQLARGPDGRWYASANYALPDRGGGEPLGWWTPARASYLDRAAALNAAIDRLRRYVADAPPRKEKTAILVWLDKLLVPHQPDLFG